MKIFALGALATIAMLPGAAFAEDYPAKDLQGIVQFSAGGGTDTYARSLQPYLEDELGKSIIMTNRTGANGSIGMQYVGQQAADGYAALRLGSAIELQGSGSGRHRPDRFCTRQHHQPRRDRDRGTGKLRAQDLSGLA